MAPQCTAERIQSARSGSVMLEGIFMLGKQGYPGDILTSATYLHIGLDQIHRVHSDVFQQDNAP